MTKLVSLADAVSQLESNPEFLKHINEIKRNRAKSPARHERQFNLELMNISAMLNFQSQQITYCHSVFLDDDYSKEDRDEAYKCRSNAILEAAKLQQQYDTLVAKLDLAIHNEDAQKVS